jgi:hypothetical protein
MKSKAINRIASVSAMVGLFCFAFALWQLWSYRVPAPPENENGEMPHGTAEIIGGLLFVSFLYSKVTLTVLAMMASFGVSFISTIGGLISIGASQCRLAWMSLLVSLDVCLLTFLGFEQKRFILQSHLVFLPTLSFIGFALSVLGVFGFLVINKFSESELKTGRLFQLFVVNGFILGVLSIAVFLIANIL